MPNWKKVIVSGSSAELTTLKLTGTSGQSSEATSLMINSSGVVGTRELGSNAFNSNTYNNYSLPLGSSSTRGGFKIGYTESGKNYPVEISSEKMYVNVPWTDTNTDTNTFRAVRTTNGETGTTLGSTETLHLVAGTNVSLSESEGEVTISSTDTNTNTTYSAGNGIGLSGTTFSVSAGTSLTQNSSGLSVTSNGIGATQLNVSGNGTTAQFLRSDADGSFTWATPTNTTYSTATSSTLGLVKIGYSENGKNYPVELSSGKMYVNVPWSDTNTDTNTQLSTEEVREAFSAGSNVTIEDGVISSTDTNTDTNTQNRYSTSVVSSSGIKLRLSGTGHNGSTSDDVKFVGAGATTVSRTDASTITITSTDTNTNTTYSAGTGLSLSGTTFSLSGDTFDNEGTYSKLRAQATTAGDVGLGSVTNESKATMFSSAALTGNPTAPTQAANNNSTRIATTAYVQTEITDLIGGAPGALDTLNELAAAIDDDASYASGITTSLGTKLPKSGGTMTGAIAMGNFNITGVNAFTFNDPGPNEGISWSGGNIKIYESPNDLTTNTAGNLQIVYGSTRRLTVDSTGINVNGNANISGTITNATWNGDVIADSYLSTNTAHLSGTQTFSGNKTFSGTLTASGGVKFTGLDSSEESKALVINSSGVVGTRGLGTGAFTSAYSLPAGSSSTRGGFKIGYSENGKNYPVEVSSEKMYVNVPWSDTNTDTNTVTQIRRDNTGTYRTGNINLVGGTNVTISEGSAGVFTITSTDTNTNTTYSAGSGLSLSGTTFSHSDTSSAGSSNNSGRTYIQDITLDTYGHVTGLSTATETVVNTDTNTQLSTSEVREAFSAGSNVTIEEGVISATDTNTNTVTQIRRDNTGTYRTGNINLVGGSNVTISETSTGVFNISSTDTNTDTNTTYLLKAIQYDGSNTNPYLKLDANSGTDDLVRLVGSGATTVTRENDGQIKISSTDTNTNTTYSTATSSTLGLVKIGYTESGKNYPVELSSGKMFVNVPWSDTNTNTTYSAGTGLSLSGTTFSLSSTYDNYNGWDLFVNSISRGTITSGENVNFIAGTNVSLGYSSTNNAITISSTDTNTDTNTFRAVRTTSGETGTSLEANETLHLVAGTNVSLSESGGEVTISSTDTNTNTFRNVTAGGNTLGSTESLDFIAGSNVSISESGGNITISSTDTNTDTNTTYSAGSGLSLSGTTFSHTDTSSAGSVNNSGNTVIQDVTLDTYGHVTGLTSKALSIPSSADIIGEFSAGDGIEITDDGEISSTVTNTNTTYSADGNYGMTLSGTSFRLENDRRRNSTSTDIYTGNTHDYTFYDASVGIRWYAAGAEDMRLANGGTLHVDGDVVAYSTTISDERLKDNVTTIENPLDKIKALRGVEYDWNAGSRKGKRDLGLIAQEVEKVIPNIVHEHEQPLLNDDEDDKTLYKTVDYEKMVAVLIEGMKEQQSQIDELKSEINQLKGKM